MLDNPGWGGAAPLIPFTIGHDIAGWVHAVGDGVEDVAPGETVAVFPLGATIPGSSRHRGLAEFPVSPASDLVRIPEGIGRRRRQQQPMLA